MYESMNQSAIVVLCTTGAHWAVMFFAIAWLLVVNGIVGFLVWKVHTMASLGRLDFKENVVPVPKAFAFPGGGYLYDLLTSIEDYDLPYRQMGPSYNRCG